MKWVDYREKLGIGFDDNNKFVMLKNKTAILLDFVDEGSCYSLSEYKLYASMVGEPIYTYNAPNGIRQSIGKAKSTKELISKFVALHNTYSDFHSGVGMKKEITGEALLGVFESYLSELNIGFELLRDDDGIFIFPKGAAELDNALVSGPLQWLDKYPESQKAFVKALKEYSECNIDNASEVADKFRKALEQFFKEFFGGNQSLENYKSAYGNFLKEQGVPSEISNNFSSLLDAYTKFNNNYAKHNDKTGLNVLEYIMYETGNIIRLLITLKKS